MFAQRDTRRPSRAAFDFARLRATSVDATIDGYRLNEGTQDLIQELSQRYDVYYLSDNVAERIEAVEPRCRFLRLFKGGVFSHEVGIRKSNRRIYEILLERTRVEARQVLFVDDKDWALMPAVQLGMKTVLFRDSEQVRQG
jgi:2-haloacid dehalogenase